MHTNTITKWVTCWRLCMHTSAHPNMQCFSNTHATMTGLFLTTSHEARLNLVPRAPLVLHTIQADCERG
eukprot:m.184467 g.184467  ORF g.184467 m.184467 type:complete len:69 (+) comp14711_c0_seq4:1165-1371(+)